MSLYRARDRSFHADFRFQGTKRLHLLMRTKSKTEARERYDAVYRLFREGREAMIEQLRTGVLTVERLARMVADNEPLVPVETASGRQPGVPAVAQGTLDEVIARYIAWLERHPNKAAGTVRVNTWQATRFADYVHEGERLGARAFAKITWPMVEAYQDALVAAATPQNSITTLMARVATLWNWCVSEEAKAARAEFRAPRPLYSPIDAEMLIRKTTHRDRALTPEESERVLAATPEPLLFAVGCGLLAGLRLAEMLHLRPGLDVDLVERVIAVRDQGEVWSPKTRRSVRYIPMGDKLFAMAERHAAKYASPSWMFTRASDPKLPMHDVVFRTHFVRVVTTAGLTYGIKDPMGVSFHTLRHSFASTAVSNGVDLYTVAQLLGDSLKTVESTYAHLSKDHKRAAIAKVERAFNIPEVAE